MAKISTSRVGRRRRPLRGRLVRMDLCSIPTRPRQPNTPTSPRSAKSETASSTRLTTSTTQGASHSILGRPIARPLVFATYLAPNILPLYQHITAAIGERLGIQTRLEVGRSFSQLINGEVDVAFLCGLPYVRLTKHGAARGARSGRRSIWWPAALLFRCDRGAGQPLPIVCGPAWRLVGIQRTRFSFRLPGDAGPAARAERDGSVLRQGGRCRLASGLHRSRRSRAARRFGGRLARAGGRAQEPARA